MWHNVRRTVVVRGLIIGLLVLGSLASPLRAANPVATNIAPGFYSRLLVGLLMNGVNAGDATDIVVNLNLCAQLTFDMFDKCMQPYLGRAHVTNINELAQYASVIGHFSVYDGFLKTAGPMNVVRSSDNSRLEGQRTDPQGKVAFFSFYPPATGEFVDFTYSTDIDSGQGYLYWVNACTLVGTFTSERLRDANGNANRGLIVARRCAI